MALVFTLGVYSLWWVSDLMREGNTNFEQDHAWEDALAAVADTAPLARRETRPAPYDARFGRG